MSGDYRPVVGGWKWKQGVNRIRRNAEWLRGLMEELEPVSKNEHTRSRIQGGIIRAMKIELDARDLRDMDDRGGDGEDE